MRFNFLKRLTRPYKAPLCNVVNIHEVTRLKIEQLEAERMTIQRHNVELIKSNRLQEKKIEVSQEQIELLLSANAESQVQIMKLNHIIKSNRRLYSGQKFYNPNNHSDVTIYVCAAFNDWYMIRKQNEIRPTVLSKAEFETTYPGYIQLPATNANLKNLK